MHPVEFWVLAISIFSYDFYSLGPYFINIKFELPEKGKTTLETKTSPLTIS